MWKVLDISGKVIQVGQLCMLFRTLGLGSYACCFALALVSEVAMFSLHQCFPTLQALCYICIYVAKGHHLSSGYFLLARGDVGVVKPGEFVENEGLELLL
jgi:hypothetical protein